MGTNYYHYKEKIKESDENSNEGLHIGKNSWGWVFHFEAHKDLGLTTVQAYKDFLKEGYIYNEYYRLVSYDEFWEMVEETLEPMPDGEAKYVLEDPNEKSPYDHYFRDSSWVDEGFAFTNWKFS